MENYYYTPEIDEFCHGFEYEILQKGEKEDSKMDWIHFQAPNTEDEWFKFTVPCPYIGYNFNRLLEQKVRVKYLDSDDVESFEFNSAGFNEHGFLFSRFIDNTPLPHHLHLGFNPNNYTVQIYTSDSPIPTKIVEGHELVDGNMLFWGTVKNKTELGKILKMIGYGK